MQDRVNERWPMQDIELLNAQHGIQYAIVKAAIILVAFTTAISGRDEITNMLCFGSRTPTRSCLFNNILLCKNGHWLYTGHTQPALWYGTSHDSSKFSDVRMATDTFFSGFQHFLQWPAIASEGAVPFAIEVKDSTANMSSHCSSVSKTAEIGDVLIVWKFAHYNNTCTRDFNNFVVQDLFPMLVVLRSHHRASLPRFRVAALSNRLPSCLSFLDSMTTHATLPLGTIAAQEHVTLVRSVILGEAGFWAAGNVFPSKRLEPPVLFGDYPNLPMLYSPLHWHEVSKSVKHYLGLRTDNLCSTIIDVDAFRAENMSYTSVLKVLANFSLCGPQEVSFESLDAKNLISAATQARLIVTTHKSPSAWFVFSPSTTRVIVVGTPQPPVPSLLQYHANVETTVPTSSHMSQFYTSPHHIVAAADENAAALLVANLLDKKHRW